MAKSRESLSRTIRTLDDLTGEGDADVARVAEGIRQRLEKRGLIRRSRSERDRRQVLVWLEEAGRKVLAQAPPPLRASFAAEFQKLPDWEQTQILSSLQRVMAMMEAEDWGGEPVMTGHVPKASREKVEAHVAPESVAPELGV